MRIAVLGRGFAGWGGGIDFLKIVLNGLLAAGPEHELVLLLPKPMPRLRDRWRAVRKGLRRRLRGEAAPPPAAGFSFEALAASFDGYRPRVRVEPFDDLHAEGLGEALRRTAPDVVLPVLGALEADLPFPWVGYVYDFQHRYFPAYFTPDLVAHRDRWFPEVLSAARVVVVNARAVKDDVARWYPALADRVIALPFGASARPEWFDLDVPAVLARHGLDRPYFAVCNQLWLHKDHPTALRALRAFLDAGGGDVHLVCTGQTIDGRDPSYFPRLEALVRELGLEGRVRFLGYVSKDDQVALVRGAIAVVQPTLFEGGPGGGAVWDAVSLGTPSLVSDIPVNLEIADEGVRYFKAQDPQDLCRAMREVAAAPPPRPGRELLLEAGRRRLARVGETLLRCAARARGEPAA